MCAFMEITRGSSPRPQDWELNRRNFTSVPRVTDIGRILMTRSLARVSSVPRITSITNSRRVKDQPFAFDGPPTKLDTNGYFDASRPSALLNYPCTRLVGFHQQIVQPILQKITDQSEMLTIAIPLKFVHIPFERFSKAPVSSRCSSKSSSLPESSFQRK